MKFLALFLAVVLLAVSVFAAPADDGPAPGLRQCVPGKSYYDGCNRCGCMPNGIVICSYRVCPGLKTEEAPDDFWVKN